MFLPSHQFNAATDIDPSVEYPPILVTTSTRDDRVHPAHARKFVKVCTSNALAT